MSVEVNPLIRVLLGVLIVAFAIVLGVVIIYRAFHAVHPAQVNPPLPRDLIDNKIGKTNAATASRSSAEKGVVSALLSNSEGPYTSLWAPR